VKVLVLNCGSSTVKYELFDMGALRSLAEGLIEVSGRVPDHRVAIEEALGTLGRQLHGLGAVGHRLVHGGERFREPVRIDAEVREAIEATATLAPLHNPPSLLGIEIALAALPGVPQVAVFDTAFHATLPERAYRYAIAPELYESYGVRRYGFHGTSHAFVSRRAAQLLGRPLHELKMVTLHLGNGASAAAIDGGRSVDTSMGLTPLEGLVMGRRCGDLDPAVTLHLMTAAGMSADQLRLLLDRESGLLGLCGTSDMREVLKRDDPDARLALDVYCYRIRKYVGAYAAALGRLDAVVFTAGVGENAAEVRSRACEGLGVLGLRLDEAKNHGSGDRQIQAEDSEVKVLVLHTDEELEIARLTAACVGG
jgi:acetate kinase